MEGLFNAGNNASRAYDDLAASSNGLLGALYHELAKLSRQIETLQESVDNLQLEINRLWRKPR